MDTLSTYNVSLPPAWPWSERTFSVAGFRHITITRTPAAVELTDDDARSLARKGIVFDPAAPPESPAEVVEKPTKKGGKG